jgi:Plasmid pRiA4b ORF-3-like protein
MLQLKVVLLGVSKPPVWRRLLVPAGIRLDGFHDVIQIAMGWTDMHLHSFTADRQEFGPPGDMLDYEDETHVTLNALLREIGDRIRYTYDFGDDWEHEITLEAVVPANPAHDRPTCLAGKGACPPEDCGGPWGYAGMREALADPAHDEHAEMLEWLGLENASEFDPAGFDLDDVNAALAVSTVAR